MASVETFWEVVDSMRTDFNLIASQHPPTADDLDQIEERLEIVFPTSYRTLATRFGAFVVEAKEEVWPAPKPGDIGPLWAFCRGLHVFCRGTDVPPALDIEKVAAQFKAEVGYSDLIPFARIQGDSDRFCFQADSSIVKWLHGDDVVEAVDGDFFDVLIAEIHQLRANAERFKRGEHRR